MNPSKITWLFLLRVAAGNLLTAKVLFDICGTEDFSLVPSNRCFYRLFSLAQIWDECRGLQDPKEPCIESCLLEDFCSKLYSDGRAMKKAAHPEGFHHCERLVSCIQKDSESAAVACYEGHLPKEGLLKGWLSLTAFGGEVTPPLAPAPAPAPAPAVEVWDSAPAPAPVTLAPKEVIEETLPISAPAFATAPQVSRGTALAAPAPAPASTLAPVQKEVMEETLPHVSEPVAPAPSAAEVVSAAPALPVPPKLPPVSCNCSISGSVKGIETGRLGCAAHNKESQVSPETKYCFMEGGSQCKDQPGAKASTEFSGLYWKPCSEIDNLMQIFPHSCQIFKTDRSKGDAAQQLVSKIKELQSSEGSHSFIPSRPLEDMKQWMAYWDVATRKTFRRHRLRQSSISP